jgi:hypothetical protein
MGAFDTAELQYAVVAYDVLMYRLELRNDPKQSQEYAEALETDVLSYVGPNCDPLSPDACDTYRVLADAVKRAAQLIDREEEGAVFKMYDEGQYGTVVVSRAVFDRLDSGFFIQHSGPLVKYMCANQGETEHLEALGVCTLGVRSDAYPGLVCDWFKISVES